jgi:hypothetical protein
MPYTWDGKRYRDVDTGRFISRTEILSYASQIASSTSAVSDAYANLVGQQTISPTDWLALFRQEIKDEHIRQYILGRGGRGSMTPADWGSIGGMLREQYSYLDGFADEIAAGTLSEAQISARSRMYINSAREAFNRAYARSQGIPDGLLPDYPGAGNTVCLTACGCDWQIEEVYETDEDGNEILAGWNCTWVLNSALENCPDCQEYAIQWNPLFVPNPNL